MKSQFVAGLFLGALALVLGSRTDGIPDVPSSKSMIEPFVDCKFGTVSCSPDCKQVEICLENGLIEIVEMCPPVSLCDARDSTCNPDLKVCNVVDPNIMRCHGKLGGRLPNPYDCHSYFECPHPIPQTPIFVQKTDCDQIRNGFDPLSGYCLLPPNHRVCKEGPIPKCVSEGQSGPVVENPNIYYICVSIEGVLQPFLARCDDDDEVFVGGTCVNLGSISTTSPVPTTTLLTTTNPTASTTADPEVTDPEPPEFKRSENNFQTIT